MAYAESTIGGTYGGSFRVWVNSIRTYDGSPSENFEEWRVEGGVNRVSATGNRIYSNGASYTTQLGLNGVAVSNGFSYDYNTATGVKSSWGTGSTRVYRDNAGNGYGFQSRTDVNLNNSPYLTSGWVTSNDGLITRYRQALLTALSMDAGGVPATDEGPMWLEFSNPAGGPVSAFIEAPGPSFPRIYTAGNVGSRYNFDFNPTFKQALQAATVNSNTATLRIGIFDTNNNNNYDYRDRTYTIKNDVGQADPTFANFTYADTNAATVAVTGSDQVLIQGKSTLSTTVSTANKATPNKQAVMSSYVFLMGAYSQSAAWSNTANVVQNMGTVSVTGAQNLSVRAVDSRGNSKTVTKSVTVLPYASPVIYTGVTIKYANGFDETGGIAATIASNAIGGLSLLTLGGVNKNDVNSTNGVQYDISKGNETSYTGTWTNIPSTVASNGWVTIDPAALQTSILSKMSALGFDNTVRWYIKFKITDKLETVTSTTYIDIGRPIFRIGTDNLLYHQEYPMSNPIVRSTPTQTAVAVDTHLQGIRRFTALSSALSISAPINYFDGYKLMFCIKDDGTSRALTWNSIFVPVGTTLPTSTVPNKWMYIGCIYNEPAAAWHVVAVNIQG